MNSRPQKNVLIIEDDKNPSWERYLKNKLKVLKSNNLEINCQDLNLSCKDISEIISIIYLQDTNKF